MARLTTSQSGHTVTVDAATSTDPDGRLVEYVWDFDDDTIRTGSRVSHTYTTADTYRIALAVKDNTGGEAFTFTDQIITMSPYVFSGFFPPLSPTPTINTVQAGQSVPMKFSLGADQGLGILATGSPAS